MRERLATSPAQDVWVELFKNIFTALYIYIRKERKWACFCLFCFLFCISLFEFSAKVPFESNWIHVQNWVKVVIIRDRRRIKFSPLLGWGSHLNGPPKWVRMRPIQQKCCYIFIIKFIHCLIFVKKENKKTLYTMCDTTHIKREKRQLCAFSFLFSYLLKPQKKKNQKMWL